MGKVVITRNQAERIQEWKYNRGILLGFHARNNLSDHSCLRSLTLDELARCLYAEEGYEVEEKFKQGEWVVIKKDGVIAKISNVYDVGFIKLFGRGANFIGEELRHATESEIAEEEKRRTNKKIDEILLGLSDYERHKLHIKLKWGEY